MAVVEDDSYQMVVRHVAYPTQAESTADALINHGLYAHVLCRTNGKRHGPRRWSYLARIKQIDGCRRCSFPPVLLQWRNLSTACSVACFKRCSRPQGACGHGVMSTSSNETRTCVGRALAHACRACIMHGQSNDNGVFAVSCLSNGSLLDTKYAIGYFFATEPRAELRPRL